MAIADDTKNKKLSIQFALTCSSGAIVLVGLTTLLTSLSFNNMDGLLTGSSGLYEQLGNTSIYKPLKILVLGIPGAIAGGMLGYFVGDILDHPRGRIPEWYLAQRQAKKAEANKPKEPILTGEELFLDEFEDDVGDALQESAMLDSAFF